MDTVYNARLNRLLELNPKQMSLDDFVEFVNALQNSKLILPLDDDRDCEELGFPFPVILFTESDEMVTPLFSDEKYLKNPNANTICLDAEDIVEFLDDIGVDFIVLNPFSENKIKFKVKSLLDNEFERKLEFMRILRVLLYNNSITLSKEIELYYRSEEPLDTINLRLPFSVSLNKDFKDHVPYLNILKLSSGDKLMPANIVFEAGHPDHIFLAPETEFELVNKRDDNTFVWKCVNQPFYK